MAFCPEHPKDHNPKFTPLLRFVHSNNIVHFRKPAFKWLFQTTCKRTQCWELLANNVAPTMLRPFARSFKGSLMLQQNSDIGAMTSIILERDVHAERNTGQHFDTKVNARQVGPHFGSNSPLYGKMPGVCPGSRRFWNRLANNLTLVGSLVPSLAQAS